MIFKKRETNQNEIRHPGTKRKVIATIVLSLSLLFGKTRLSSFQSLSPNFDNEVVQERIIDDQEFCSLEDNDQRVILVKTGDSATSVPTSTGRGQPSDFPTPSAGGRPNRPVYVAEYSTAPKVVPGLGAGGNPGNGGDGYGNNGQEDECPIPKEDIEQSSQGQGKYGVKKYQVKSQIGKHNKLKKISKKIRKNPKLVKEFARLKEKLEQGNLEAGKGTKYLPDSNDIYYARGATEGARIYFQYSGDNIITIIGESNKATQKEVINFLLKNY